MHYRHAAAALLLICPSLLQAADSPPETATGPVAQEELDTVVVTATRTPRARSATLAPTTVITRADIERLQAQSVRELLQRSPGISVANQGGAGKLTSLFVRGTESDHVLVLVNGVRYGDATSGIPAIQDLPVEQIERIEIVRGPRSSLYGADAIGGVIQIFTRDGGDRPATPYFKAGMGRYDSYEGQVGVAGGSGRANYNLSISGTESDGFNACTGSASAGCFSAQPDTDDDGYSRVAGTLRGGYRFDNGLQLNAHALRTEGDTEFDGSVFVGNRSDTLRQIYGLSLAGRFAEFWNAELSVGRTIDESNDFFDGQPVSDFKTERDSVGLQNDMAIGTDDLLTFGLDYRREVVASTTDYEQTRRDNAGAYLQYLGRWGSHELQLAARGDDNEQFGEHATGSVTWGWDVTEVHTVTASYGTAFKAPTFNELYFPGASNPNLEPEESRSIELGLLGNREWGRWSVHAYDTRVDEQIALDSAFIPQNISQTRLRGVEAQADASLGAWLVKFNAGWLDAENRADGANRGNELPRRPEYSAQLDLDRQFGRYSAGTGLFVAGSRFDDLANSRRLEGYELVELRGGVRIGADWRVQARVSNLLDEEYETAAFYNQPGRSLFVTLRYQP